MIRPDLLDMFQLEHVVTGISSFLVLLLFSLQGLMVAMNYWASLRIIILFVDVFISLIEDLFVFRCRVPKTLLSMSYISDTFARIRVAARCCFIRIDSTLSRCVLMWACLHSYGLSFNLYATLEGCRR
jgi:hypothetical protein